MGYPLRIAVNLGAGGRMPFAPTTDGTDYGVWLANGSGVFGLYSSSGLSIAIGV
jgi:hypothetical protein